jgi:hypothetical protein
MLKETGCIGVANLVGHGHHLTARAACAELNTERAMMASTVTGKVLRLNALRFGSYTRSIACHRGQTFGKKRYLPEHH